MDCKKVSLIINPRTGQNVSRLPDILAVLAAAGWDTEVVLKEYAGHAMTLTRQACKAGKELVIAYGGDGTSTRIWQSTVFTLRSYDKHFNTPCQVKALQNRDVSR